MRFANKRHRCIYNASTSFAYIFRNYYYSGANSRSGDYYGIEMIPTLLSPKGRPRLGNSKKSSHGSDSVHHKYTPELSDYAAGVPRRGPETPRRSTTAAHPLSFEAHHIRELIH